MTVETKVIAKMYNDDGSYIRLEQNDIVQVMKNSGEQVIGKLQNFLEKGISIEAKNHISHVVLLKDIASIHILKNWPQEG